MSKQIIYVRSWDGAITTDNPSETSLEVPNPRFIPPLGVSEENPAKITMPVQRYVVQLQEGASVRVLADALSQLIETTQKLPNPMVFKVEIG